MDGRSSGQGSERSSKVRIVRLELPEPTAEQLSSGRERLATLDAATSAAALPKYGYLFITPLGMPARTWLEEQMRARGIDVQARVHLADWQRIATAVHLTGRSAERLRTAALFEAAWQKLHPSQPAEAWRIQLALQPAAE